MVKKIQYLFVLITAFTLAVGFSLSKGKSGSVKIIVIDAGHGGKDPGCSGLSYKEKDVALAVALKLGKLIEENLKNVKVIYTRTTDVFVIHEERAQIANKAKADLFISIHCNASGKPVMVTDKRTGKKRAKTYRNKKGKIVVVEKPNPVHFGTETYVMGLKNEAGNMKVAKRENSAILLEDDYEKKYEGFDPESEESYIIMSNYTSAYVIQSAKLAVKIQEEYTKKAGRIDKGVHRQSLWVLWRTAMPSILTELGFLTNPIEEQFLGSEAGQDYLAKAIFRGIRKYKDDLEGNKKEYSDEIENQVPIENENIKAGNIPGQKTDEEDEEANVKQEAEGSGLVSADKKPALSEAEGKNEVEEKKEDAKTDIKEKVSESTQIELSKNNTFIKNQDSLKITAKGIDSLQESAPSGSAKEIADKFKKEQKAKEDKRLEASGSKHETVDAKQEAGSKKQEVRQGNEIEVKKANQNTIVFKVQFASSDVELNLNQDKFKGVSDVSFFKVKNILKYTSGNFSLIKDAAAHQNFLREKGLKDCFVIALKNGERIDINTAMKEVGQ